jgi:Leucine Rich repeat
MRISSPRVMGTAALLLVLLAISRSGADESEKNAVMALEALGGIVTHDETMEGSPLVGAYFSHTARVTDAGLKNLKELKGLRTLDLGKCQVTDAGLKELRELNKLEVLMLDSTKVSDAGLKELKDLKRLHTLDLDNTKITDDGLKELKGLKELQVLSLVDTKVTDAGLKHLEKLKNLQTLCLISTQATEAGKKELKKALPKCDIVLIFQGCGISGNDRSIK